MADKQYARSGTSDFDLLAEDDPLSELARIVGYEEKPPAVRPEPQSAVQPSAIQKLEPVFGLEDELMRAFEDYEAPRFDPVKTVADRFAERDLKDREPVFEAGMFDDAPAAAPQVEVAPQAYPAEEPDAFEPEAVAYSSDILADDDIDDAVSFDPEPVAAAQPDMAPVFTEEDAYQAEGALADDGEALGLADEAPAAWPPADAEEFRSPELPVADLDTVSDLERELELSIGYAEPEPFVSPAEAVVQDGSAFAAPARAQDAGPDVFNEDFAGDEPAFETAFHAEPEVQSVRDDVDALLDEVDMFPVPAPSHTVAMEPETASSSLPDMAKDIAEPAARKSNYPFTPTFGRATPVAVAGGAAVSSAFATPLSQTRSAPVTEEADAEPPVDFLTEADTPAVGDLYSAFEEPRNWATTISREEESSPAAVTDEPEVNIEFDLDGLALDLSDLDFDADPAEFAMSADEAFADMKAAPVQHAAEPATVLPEFPAYGHKVFEEPVREEPVHEVQAREERPLPFDPSLIADAGEPVSAMADMNVPSLPVVEKESPRALPQDDEFDIDSEMEQFFAASKPVAEEKPHPAAEADLASDPVWAAAREQVERKQQAGADGLDDFERALEADFRRSLSEPRMASSSMRSDNFDPDYGAYEEEPRRRIPLAAMAVAAAAVLIIGGAGVYAFFGGDNGQASSDGPQIILADKEPVKIVPEERGGKTVPNQDKAVYDRVSGNQGTDPTQESLVSTTEEPVDVVQRTLAPENSLPLEGEGDDIAFRLPGVEGDARLLPETEPEQTATAEQQPASGVSPRKVRTMIVKPDGTLVAREETVVESEPEPATRDVAIESSVKPVGTQVAEAEPVETPIRQSEAELTQPENLGVQTNDALTEAANATVEGTAPVRTVKTTTISGQTPIPGTRPAEQPVNVVGTVTDRGNVRDNAGNTAAAETAENTQVAAVNPGGYVVQIASLPSEADANASYKNLSKKFASVIGGRGVDIRKADIPGKGTFYRVRIPAGSKAEAIELCTRYKSAGGSCLVSK